MPPIKTSNDQLGRLSKDSFKSSDKYDIHIILDNLRSGLNIGSIFRSSDAFKIKRIYITGQSAIPPNKEILKTALGATETVDWEYHENAVKLLKDLSSQGLKTYAVEQTNGSISLADFELEENMGYCFIFGNEVEGVQQELINLCDGCIEIPQFGTKHSLNVAVSSGMVIWHLAHQLIKKGKL